MAASKIVRVATVAGAIILICLTLVLAGGLALGFAAHTSAFLLHLLEFVWAVGIPVLGAGVLAWFAYKLFIEPVIRRHKLERIREYRARRNLPDANENQPL